MKRILLSGLAALPLMLAAQTIYFEDDFESYTAGDYIAAQSTTWTTWGNAPGTTEDAFVSDFLAQSGTNSLLLESPGGNGPTDLVLPLGDQTSGQWNISFSMYVVTNNGGYFNLQKAEAPGTEWAIEVYFDADGTGTWEADGTEYSFFYTNGAWVEIEIYIDIDADEARGFVEGVEIVEWQWSTESSGGPGLSQLGGVNIFAAANSGAAMYYFDDMTITGPDAFVTGIEENEALAFELFPNPVVNALNISIDQQQDLYINVYDLTGKMVMSNVAISYNTGVTTVDVSELNSGMYLLEMTNDQQHFTRRFVKE